MPSHSSAPPGSSDPTPAPGPPPDRLRRVRWLLAIIFLAGAAVLAGTYYLNRPPAGMRVPRVSLRIRQTAQGFVLTRAEGGRTLFRLTARVATEMKAGSRTILRAAQLVIYDRDGVHADRISGRQFRYDPGTGRVVAVGRVHIALEASRPARHSAAAGNGARVTPSPRKPPGHPPAVAAPAHSGPRASPVEVLAQQLAFNTKTGSGVIRGGLDFRYWNATGHADRARLVPGSNLLVLSGRVRLRWAPPGRWPLRVTAGQATLNKSAETITLQASPHGGDTPVVVLGPRRLRAQRLVFYLRRDYSVRTVRAQGGVQASGAQGGRRISVRCQQALARLRRRGRAAARGRAKTRAKGPLEQSGVRLSALTLSGGVMLSERQGARWQRLRAASLRVRFAGRNLPTTARAEQAVLAFAGGSPLPGPITAHGAHAAAAGRGGNSRHGQRSRAAVAADALAPALFTAGGSGQLAAPAMRFQFAAAPPAVGRAAAHAPQAGGAAAAPRAVLRQAETVGRGTLRYQSAKSQTATMTADQFQLRLTPQQRPQWAQAMGQVQWRQKQGARTQRSGSADQVQAWMSPLTGRVRRIVERGHVFLRAPAAGTAQPGRPVSSAAAQSVRGGLLVWNAANGAARLTPGGDGARVTASFPGGRLAAAQFTLAAARLTAEGGVTASLRSDAAGLAGLPTRPGHAAGSLPVTITARRFSMSRDGEHGRFRGAVRVWQGSNVMRAAELRFDRRAGTVTASGGVRSEFLSPQGGDWASGEERLAVAPASAPCPAHGACGPARRRAPAPPKQPVAVRVTAPLFRFWRGKKLAEYSGGVEVNANKTRVTCRYIDIVLGAAGGGLRPRRVVAGGGVELTQPGRRARARQAVYDAGPRTITLRGGSPSIFDASLGLLAGHTLTFSPLNDTIRVESGPHTRTFAAYRVHQ